MKGLLTLKELKTEKIVSLIENAIEIAVDKYKTDLNNKVLEIL